MGKALSSHAAYRGIPTWHFVSNSTLITSAERSTWSPTARAMCTTAWAAPMPSSSPTARPVTTPSWLQLGRHDWHQHQDLRRQRRRLHLVRRQSAARRGSHQLAQRG
ncbi:hypothetical protein AB5I41_17350 [Sphingomonas sp. MMS24-JH45]